MKRRIAIGSMMFLLIVLIAPSAGASDESSPATTGPALKASFTFATNALAVELQPALMTDKAPDSSAQRPLVLPALYIASAGLQAFDVYSTISVLERGGVERNPLMKGLVSRPATFIALKAGVTTASVAAAERLWRSDRRKSAVALMLASTFVMGVLAAHNATVLSSIR